MIPIDRDSLALGFITEGLPLDFPYFDVFVYGGEGGILNQALELSYHVFSNIRKNRMDIGDFHDLACCNCFYPST